MALPHPQKKLAGCCWLPRFAAKIRLLRSGKMPFLYRIALGNKIGIDGYFFRHFRISLRQFIKAIESEPTPEALAAWFLARPEVDIKSIAEWNALAVKLGCKGHPAYLTRQIVKWVLYPKSIAHPVESIFEAIIQDENLSSEDARVGS